MLFAAIRVSWNNLFCSNADTISTSKKTSVLIYIGLPLKLGATRQFIKDLWYRHVDKLCKKLPDYSLKNDSIKAV